MATSTWLAGFQMTTVEVTDLIAGSAYIQCFLPGPSLWKKYANPGLDRFSLSLAASIFLSSPELVLDRYSSRGCVVHNNIICILRSPWLELREDKVSSSLCTETWRSKEKTRAIQTAQLCPVLDYISSGSHSWGKKTAENLEGRWLKSSKIRPLKKC